MAIIRSFHNKENPFVQINRAALRNNNLSLRARGLWALCLSYPADWKFHVSELIKQCKEGRDAIYASIKELIENNYAIRIEICNKKENGKLSGKEIEYVFFEFQIEDNEKVKYIEEFKKCYRCPPFQDPGNPHLQIDKLATKKEQQATKGAKAPAAASFSKTKQEAKSAPPEPFGKPEQLKKPKVYQCLEKIDIPEMHKARITKQYAEQTVQKALDFVMAPNFNIKTTLSQAISWSCKEEPFKEERKASLKEHNKSYAMKYQYAVSSSSEVLCWEDYVTISGLRSQFSFSIPYNDKDFMILFKSTLIERDFEILEE